ncbi:hypothetical protein A2765_05755 [Candidatus Kaiserbacteria bacterium RIFCSPHIGHO2_01_FULL_56_24]|uniref:Uncharacterized protein n=1 Tax=Candidatus Kaiserbacteria bacterium RIFCSPHIGHO2_01_FULL_56_24 TaxID=1798487 RepID=A0A1F6DAI5_9BACT|nr:MAG: hypothetical protein A2765_05755 [Candidatus Kaiserbacteria bacterium RIFCSPHIGHO2_01_FULL_56_24]
MHSLTAPFSPGSKVRPAPHCGLQLKEYTVKAVMMTRTGWFVLLDETSIGLMGEMPAAEFNSVQLVPT